ncbi:hypothetical protein ECMP0210172_4281 [Escherichia coli MP021017.2]|nr:hypothetical protein ECMP0210172_4281 [Escherichia coli MP021017.2]
MISKISTWLVTVFPCRGGGPPIPTLPAGQWLYGWSSAIPQILPPTFFHREEGYLA